MKPKIYFFVIIFLLLSSCNRSDKVPTEHNNPKDILLSDFIIGGWYGETDTVDHHGSYSKEYFIQFIDEKKLSFIVRPSLDSVDGVKAIFTYQFIDEKTLLVENRRAKGGKWYLNRDGENLQICIWSDSSCVNFTRDT